MSSVSRALAELRGLSRAERVALGEAVLLLPAVQAMQRLLPFRRWRRLLTPTEVARVDSAKRGRTPSPRQVADAVVRARRLVPGSYRCLPMAYATHLLLARHGHPSQVHVGVSRDPHGKVEAHAWVVCEGHIVVGDLPDLSRFVPLPALTAVLDHEARRFDA